MIDLSLETVVAIADAREHIPGKPSVGTVWRWVLSGVRGRKLESCLIGGRRYTSLEAIQRFAVPESPKRPAASPRTNRQRQAAIARAEREVAKAGI